MLGSDGSKMSARTQSSERAVSSRRVHFTAASRAQFGKAALKQPDETFDGQELTGGQLLKVTMQSMAPAPAGRQCEAAVGLPITSL
ncbi:MAG: hypothetical protein ACYDAQ_07050 [Mycobacteriales bacterium]